MTQSVIDKQVRYYIYEYFVKTGQAPTLHHCAQAWYADRMDMEWRRKTEEEIDVLWQELGLTSPFWDIHF
jgi:hypothetical protein